VHDPIRRAVGVFVLVLFGRLVFSVCGVVDGGGVEEGGEDGLSPFDPMGF
jgi:hypothetical protein